MLHPAEPGFAPGQPTMNRTDPVEPCHASTLRSKIASRITTTAPVGGQKITRSKPTTPKRRSAATRTGSPAPPSATFRRTPSTTAAGDNSAADRTVLINTSRNSNELDSWPESKIPTRPTIHRIRKTPQPEPNYPARPTILRTRRARQPEPKLPTKQTNHRIKNRPEKYWNRSR